MAAAPLKCMFDTRAFNLVLDVAFPIEKLKGRVLAYATHIQRDEINNTMDPERRSALLRVFEEVTSESFPTASLVLGVSRIGAARLGGERVVPTESFVWDVSRWDQAKWTAEDNLYVPIKEALDKLNKGKRNNVQDALIAETAAKGSYILVTDDTHMIEVAKRYGCKCMSLEEIDLVQ
jgi:predicted nucleic acid-binding protein